MAGETASEGNDSGCPLVSVIIPAYNAADFIGRTLASVSRQSWRGWECLVVDDGSRDRTMGVVGEYASGDSRFHSLRRNRPPKNASTCRNIGLQQACGQYLLFLDSDDLLRPDCLAQRIACLQENPDLDFAVFKVALEDTGRIHNRYPESAVGAEVPATWPAKMAYLRMFLAGTPPWQTSAPLWRRASLLKLNGFDERFPRRQDMELHTRAIPVMRFAVFRDVEPDCLRQPTVREQRPPGFGRIHATGFMLYLETADRVVEQFLAEPGLAELCRRDLGEFARRAMATFDKYRLDRWSLYRVCRELVARGIFSRRQALAHFLWHGCPGRLGRRLLQSRLYRLARGRAGRPERE